MDDLDLSEENINRVMHMDPKEFSANPKDLFVLVAFHRKAREEYVPGKRPKKEVVDVSITLESLRGLKPKPKPTLKPVRRF